MQLISIRINAVHRIPGAVGIGADAVVLLRHGVDLHEGAGGGVVGAGAAEYIKEPMYLESQYPLSSSITPALVPSA